MIPLNGKCLGVHIGNASVDRLKSPSPWKDRVIAFVVGFILPLTFVAMVMVGKF